MRIDAAKSGLWLTILNGFLLASFFFILRRLSLLPSFGGSTALIVFTFFTILATNIFTIAFLLIFALLSVLIRFNARAPKTAFFVTLLILFLCSLSYSSIRIYFALNYPFRIRVWSWKCNHDLRPNVRLSFEKWGKYLYPFSTNSLGFVDDASRHINAAKPGKHRIVFIGDSFTEGIGTPFRKTFVGIIQRKLQNKAEVLNAGVSSYCPKLEFLKLRNLMEKGFRFDELFLCIDPSDMQDEVDMQSFIPDEEFLRREINNDPAITEKTKKLVADWDSNSDIRNDSRRRWSIDSITYAEFIEVGKTLERYYVDKMVALCRNNGIALTIVVYPWPIMIEKKDFDSMHARFWRDYCTTSRISFINLFPLFQQLKDPLNRYFIAGDDHWNADGHGVVAQEILKYMKHVK